MVSHRSHNFSIAFPKFYSTSFSPPFQSPQRFFHKCSSSFTQSSHSLPDVSINLSFHFINFSSVLPWCYSISPSLPLCYLSVPNAYPNTPPTIPTVAPYKWFCSFLPWLTAIFHCFSIVSRVLYAIMVPHRSLNFSIVFPSHKFPSFYSYSPPARLGLLDFIRALARLLLLLLD